ncbi:MULTISPECIES: DUF805 domain-containing protein [unclassified Micromonospora]|uniref:DUF805 domain-containing protein n=1 Tax=unclassified Micromonospora TaxID=2617518 RepID=UPI002417B4DD|nr:MULTISPECIES: DUF805 domain-containing protein [unclassified Micromonospora]MDG4835009.1 DUF805 domain-containing protein [Micromonospora sp. WMMD967]WFF01339.1 DUF805 domain-containing protein [Micromonospora sp. WMMD964]
MSFIDAVKSVLSKYVGFTGRARRSEYWWFALFTILVSIVASILDGALGLDFEGSTTGLIGLVASLALLLPSLAVGVRRLHDTDRTGWWLLIALVPLVGFIVLIVFFVLDSTPGTNRFGPNPKG